MEFVQLVKLSLNYNTLAPKNACSCSIADQGFCCAITGILLLQTGQSTARNREYATAPGETAMRRHIPLGSGNKQLANCGGASRFARACRVEQSKKGIYGSAEFDKSLFVMQNNPPITTANHRLLSVEAASEVSTSIPLTLTLQLSAGLQ
jgi:hypothetical protein